MKKDETCEIIDTVSYDMYKALRKKNPTHIFRTHYEMFQETNLSDLKKKLNRFSDNHNVIYVDVKPHSFSQKGTMLCDRINPYSDTATIYMATVSHLVDITNERANEDMTKWLESKVKARFGDGYESFGHKYFTYVETGRQRSVREMVVDFVNKLMESSEYKAQWNLFIEKYSIKKEK